MTDDELGSLWYYNLGKGWGQRSRKCSHLRKDKMPITKMLSPVEHVIKEAASFLVEQNILFASWDQ